MDNEEVKSLIKRYKINQCTEAEKALVEDWFMQYNEQEINISPERIKELGKQIYNAIPGVNVDNKKPIIKLWPGITSAAAALLLAMFTWIYINNPTIPAKPSVQDIAPGGNKATLTLANGKTIILSDIKTGIKIDRDKIMYNDDTPISNDNTDDVSGLATISTPNGGEYQIVLQDGTKVWLNAASTLLYPTTFRARGARKVELRGGEAYFQVTKDSKRPFVVTTRDQDVMVLGTTFNVNAYSDQAEIKTTLVEGSVKVAVYSGTPNALSKIIKPGEQAVFHNKKIAVKPVDLSLEIAWQKGKIQFENAELITVMSMLARWYNIDVEYQYYPSKARFSGSIARSKNISEILELLQSTGDAHFKISERKVLVMK
jgi:transmembrane sensor